MVIPDEYYKKTLNPYNSNKEKYTRFPATMRNLDIMSDITRRYVSEYLKGIHDYIVGVNDPDIIINKDARLKQEVTALAQQAFAVEFQKKYQELINQGTPQEQINPETIMPDIETFIKDFNEKYIDEKGAFDISKCDLIAYSNGKYYSMGKKIGKFGFSVEKNKKTRKK